METSNIMFTHSWTKEKGWTKTIANPNDFKEIVYFGNNEFDGDLFMAKTHGGYDMFLKGVFAHVPKNFKVKHCYEVFGAY